MHPQAILFIHHANDMYGADIGLLHSLKSLDRERYYPIVILPYDLSPITFHPDSGGSVDHQLIAATNGDDFPVWAEARLIAKAAAQGSDYWFQSHNSGKATRALLLQIQVSHKTLPASTISLLVSVAVDAIAYSGLQRHLSDLRKSDIETILNTNFAAPIDMYQKPFAIEEKKAVAVAKLTFSSLKDSHQAPTPEDPEGRAALPQERDPRDAGCAHEECRRIGRALQLPADG